MREASVLLSLVSLQSILLLPFNMFKLLLVVFAMLAVAASQYVSSYGYPYGSYSGAYRSGVGYSGYAAYPYAAYRSGYYGVGYY